MTTPKSVRASSGCDDREQRKHRGGGRRSRHPGALGRRLRESYDQVVKEAVPDNSCNSSISSSSRKRPARRARADHGGPNSKKLWSARSRICARLRDAGRSGGRRGQRRPRTLNKTIVYKGDQSPRHRPNCSTKYCRRKRKTAPSASAARSMRWAGSNSARAHHADQTQSGDEKGHQARPQRKKPSKSRRASCGRS